MDKLQNFRVHRIANGYCFEAPGVYLWDDDLAEVERAARELARGAPLARPTRRMLIIPPQKVAPAQRRMRAALSSRPTIERESAIRAKSLARRSQCEGILADEH